MKLFFKIEGFSIGLSKYYVTLVEVFPLFWCNSWEIYIVLRSDPFNTDAMLLKADTYIHMERYDQAESIAREVLAINENELEAIAILCNVYYQKANWTSLLEVTEKTIHLHDTYKFIHRIKFYLAEAMIEVGDLPGADDVLNGICDNRKFIANRKSELIKILALKRGVSL